MAGKPITARFGRGRPPEGSGSGPIRTDIKAPAPYSGPTMLMKWAILPGFDRFQKRDSLTGRVVHNQFGLFVDRHQIGDSLSGSAVHHQFVSQVVRQLDDAHEVLPIVFVRQQLSEHDF